MNFLQPQCSDEDCCGNGIDGSSCTPQAWVNACSIGWYLTDRCELDILFRIKKDGAVIVGPSTAFSYSMTPPDDEVADYAVEYCIGPEPCTWVVVWEAEVDTTDVDACPMGIYGQTYVIGTDPSDNEQEPMAIYVYCQSFLVVRASALAAFGQNITHLWIDDVLFTPNTNFAGGIATEGGGDPLSYSFMCHSGRSYGHADVPWNDTTLTQIRIPLPIAFTKGSVSVRARQTNGMIVGCTVDFTCTAHYNAASVTLPSWDGMSLACEANGAMPFGFMGTPSPVKTWCKHFETSLIIEPTGDTGGTFSWRTCQASTTNSMVVGSFSVTYNFKCNGDIRWVDPTDSVPRPVYSGTYSFDHTVTFSFNLVLGAVYSPGALTVGGIDAVISGDITSTITGHNDWPAAIQASLGAINWLGTPGLNDTYSGGYFNNPNWFIADLVDGLGCGPPPFDGETFQWKWTGPQLPLEFWQVFTPDFPGFSIVPSPISYSGGLGSEYTNATWPADTSFYCELPEGSYYDVTESAVATQFQV